MMMDQSEEQRLRELVRRELEARERMKAPDASPKSAQWSQTDAERQKIIADEIRRYYEARGNYQSFTNEEGEAEWLTAEEIAERQMQIPVDVEELEEGQKHVRAHFLVIALLGFLILTLMIFAMRERTGSVQVISNVPGSTIVLDGTATEFRTDFMLKDLSPGAHLISVQKMGYGIVGDPARRIEVEAGEEKIVIFELQPRNGGGFGQSSN
jgi:hypothetical protein